MHQLTIAQINMINKKTLINDIIKTLKHDLTKATIAAKEAHAAATDDESVAETQYDTLAIEAGYLAEGHSKRIIEIQTSIIAFEALDIDIKSMAFDTLCVKLGSLIQLNEDEPLAHWFFLAPFAGGLRLNIEGQNITVITPQSPMGAALLGKEQDDDIDMTFSSKLKQDYIVKID